MYHAVVAAVAPTGHGPSPGTGAADVEDAVILSKEDELVRGLLVQVLSLSLTLAALPRGC